MLLSRLVKELPGEHTVLFAEIDGHFPNHHPDPTVPNNLQDLIHNVEETGADLGIVFDGDADRIGVVDDQGQILWGTRFWFFWRARCAAESSGGNDYRGCEGQQGSFR